MSPHTNVHAPGTSLSGRIQIGHKSGLLLLFYLSVNIKPPRHRFGFSLAWGWQLMFTSVLIPYIRWKPVRPIFLVLIATSFVDSRKGLFLRRKPWSNNSHLYLTIIIQNNKDVVQDRTTEKKLNPNELQKSSITCLRPHNI